ncbi:UDP-2,3-diacylglucosamine diphosphatase [Acidihalobacter ferrooxydans]|uniref:UDP-2,3-diacylglucosamine hydrolase n=1 Tax=Acidihalobacter ferrooxydans TaxID=1765967 RepID=A0A1P8UER6_9GAMM|nr:UDP-2,3-diacylglucosamine diphosphatase [Acidihalobacter ferrooxydans]APZ42337.1 UDP-2,3-diacylglucosamine diphosphatase [Acidihalobacter ferrooxydans]
MAETLFISDLHLDPSRPEVIDLLTRFMTERAAQAEGLYILGDLFEYWIGDDDVRPGLEPVIDALRRLTDGGVSAYFMAGNRDFLVGEGFAAATGCTLLDDPASIDLYGVPTLLMHGDTLCTDDVTYMQLRKQLRDPAFQAGFLALPVAQRRVQAEALRRQSREATSTKAMDIMDVNADAVCDALRSHGVHRLIHGHTHRPASHTLAIDGQPAERIVLGDWYTQGSVLSVTPRGHVLETLDIRR